MLSDRIIASDPDTVGAAAPAVRARGLRKSYGERVAVNGIDFAVEPGSCFGFLGPNGAGKTTTLKM
ncbi:MAG TPA: ATP-binding cassette domain-containing protein, partial [Solirubrobacterales bacterium]